LTGQPSKNIGPTACGEAYEDPHRSRRIGLHSCATRGGWERGGTATRCRNRRRWKVCGIHPARMAMQHYRLDWRPARTPAFRFLRQGLGCPFAILCSRALLHAAGCSRKASAHSGNCAGADLRAEHPGAPGPLHRTNGGFVLPTPRTDFFACPEEPDFAFHFFGFTANIIHAFGNHATDAVVAIRPQASGSKERSDLAVRDRPFHVPPRSQYFTLSRARGRTRCTKYPAGCGSLFSFSASVDRNGSPANAAGLPCRH
jgi:hypothetical protein